MELIERDEPLHQLQSIFEEVEEGEGHIAFISGEAGMGKTSLVKEFCNRIKMRSRIYQGTCDALFAPRPLAPLYDVLVQLPNGLPQNFTTVEDRSILFAQFFYELKIQKETTILLFEDIHWADEATLDFVKFL